VIVSAKPRPLPRDFENLEFETLEENWNRYELKNHTVVRGRVIVTRFAKDSHDPTPNAYALSSQNVFVVDAPVEQRGEPTLTPLTPDQIKNPKGTPVNIVNSNEVWNRYRILSTGVVLKVKLIVQDAMRLTPDRFDSDGMPQYLFRSSPMVVPDRFENTNLKT